ncbi:hypothetical protein [Formosa sp. A9]|uniref:hypothetical protein n=1 Tax=Formosa sp. A9 TaxID=3442641 RepID=UPI003EBE2833
MKTQKSLVIILLFFVNAFAFAQETAYDLREIVDMRGSSSEQVLEDKGYHLESVDKSSAGIYQNWWNSRKNQCVSVRLVDGRVQSVVKAPELDCGKSSSSSHHSSNDRDDINLYELSGMSEPSASSRLQDNGYVVKKSYGSSLISLYWYKERNDKCLLMLVKNDRVSSVTKVSSSLCGGDSNYSSSSSRNSSHRSNSHSSNRGVTLYKDCGFRGSSVTLDEGRYNHDELGIGNDNLSSIEVPRGYKITIYQNENYGGKSKTYYNDVNCLTDDDMNDRTSSIRISRD